MSMSLLVLLWTINVHFFTRLTMDKECPFLYSSYYGQRMSMSLHVLLWTMNVHFFTRLGNYSDKSR